MNLELISSFLTTLGEIIIGYSVIRVHGKVEHEHKIDEEVIKEMHKEKWWAISGIVFILAGFIIKWFIK